MTEDIISTPEGRAAINYFHAHKVLLAPLGGGLDGAEVINGFVDGLKATMEEEDRASQARYTRRLNGPSSLQVWIDEAQEWRDAHAPSAYSELFDQEGRLTSVSMEMTFHSTSDQFMALMLGYGSAEEMREDARKRQHLWNQVDDVLARPVDAPPVDVDNVRWPSDNRKLYARRDGKTSELYRILGVTPHDSYDSEVQ